MFRHSLAISAGIACLSYHPILGATPPVSAHKVDEDRGHTVCAYSGFEAYAPLVARLAAEPDRADELKFVEACRGRLLKKVDRTEATPALLERFKKQFKSEKVHPITGLVVATLIANTNGGFSKAEGELGRKLLKDDKWITTPDELALHLHARIGLARHRATGDSIENEFQIKEAFLATYQKKGYQAALPIDPRAADLLFDIFIAPPADLSLVTKERGTNAKFFELLRAIPSEAKNDAILVALGRHELKLAWEKRGGAWASKTTPEQFAGFEKHLNQAVPYFRQALALNRNNLGAYRGLMTVSMADESISGESTDAIMRAAEHIDPENAELLKHYAFSSSLRWGGSAEAIIKTYRTLLNSRNYDSEKPGLAGIIINNLIKDLGGSERQRYQELRARDYVNVANGYIRRFNQTGKPLIGQSGKPYDFRAVALAYLADANLLSLANLLEPYTRPGFPADEEAFVDYYRNTTDQGSFARSLASTEANNFTVFESIAPTALSLGANVRTDPNFTHKNFSDVTWLKERDRELTLMRQKVAAPAAQKVVRSFHAMIKNQLGFHEGKTVPLVLDREVWQTTVGGMELKDGKMINDSFTWNSGNHLLTYEAVFPTPYELTMVLTGEIYDKWPRVGLHIGRVASGVTGRSFVLERDTGKTFVMRPRAGVDKATLRRENKNVGKTATLRVRVFNHGYSFSVNDEPAVARHDPDFIPDRISVGAPYGFRTFGRFEYSGITARKIPAEELSEQEASWMSAPHPF